MASQFHNLKTARIFLYTLFFALCAFNINAQDYQNKVLPEEVMAWTKSTLDTVNYRKYSSLAEGMRINNFQIPLVFSGGKFQKFSYKFTIDSLFSDIPKAITYNNRRMNNMFKYYLFKKQLEDNAYRKVMLNNPANFKYRLKQLPKRIVKSESIEKPIENVKINVEFASKAPEEVNPVIKFIPDRKYWKSTFAADLKFSQNKSSDNWHTGQIDNMNIYSNLVTTYNYTRDRLTLTNTLSSTVTVNSAPKDTTRSYTIGSNELRFRSNFGLRAVRNWSYSASGEFVTPLLNKYLVNSDNKNSAFLAPITINIGLGMTFAGNPKFKKADRSYNINLSLEPLSFKYIYSNDKDIQLAAFFPRNEDGTYQHVLRTFGSTLTMTNNVKFNKIITLYSRFYYFTNYERIISEFENKFDIALSRYFSTTLHIFLRYDDGVAKAENSDTYLQVNELFSFGFSYRW
jgi:hypothetical protein